MLTHFVDRHDVRMVQARRGFGLGVKPSHFSFAGELPGQHHFHRHNAVQAHLPRFIDHPHAAAVDLLQQFVVAEPHGGLLSHVRHLVPPFADLLQQLVAADPIPSLLVRRKVEGDGAPRGGFLNGLPVSQANLQQAGHTQTLGRVPGQFPAANRTCALVSHSLASC